jgi:hypothetical protein
MRCLIKRLLVLGTSEAMCRYNPMHPPDADKVATLIVQLPSDCTGGRLVCKRDDIVEPFVCGNSDANYVRFLLWPEGEYFIEPILSGYKILLEYSIF